MLNCHPPCSEDTLNKESAMATFLNEKYEEYMSHVNSPWAFERTSMENIPNVATLLKLQDIFNKECSQWSLTSRFQDISNKEYTQWALSLVRDMINGQSPEWSLTSRFQDISNKEYTQWAFSSVRNMINGQSPGASKTPSLRNIFYGHSI